MDKKGLTSKEAARRLKEHGPNELEEKKKENILLKFFSHFLDFLVLLLIAAAIVAFFLGEIVDAIMIGIIVLMQGVLGFVQEYRAEKAFDALRRMMSQKSRVLRDGHFIEVDTRELVPGDIVLLEAGDRVPADGVVVEEAVLSVDEAALSGESVPVHKHADGKGKMFMGTVVVSGKGKMLVESTGKNTKMGKISEIVQTVKKERTPLEVGMEKTGKQLGIGALTLCGIVFIAGLWQGFPPFEMFLTSVSLAVAAIPEGLAAVVVITLAVGVQRMSRKNAIVKKLKSVETLGCANVICTDKTGTLTKNEMSVRTVLLPGGEVEVSGSGYAPKGKFSSDGKEVAPGKERGLRMIMEAGVLCNGAYLRTDSKTGAWGVLGDPTEGSLVVLAAKAGIYKEEIEKKNPVVAEFPFDSTRKMMSVVRKSGGKKISYVKGAPEIVLSESTRILDGGKARKLTEAEKKRIEEQNNGLTSRGYRTLGIAYKEMGHGKINQKSAESGLVLLGIVGIMDSPREEVKNALALCREAGIRVIMITGDHPQTANAIAKELGIGNGKFLIGEELDKLDEEGLRKAVEEISVYARVSPEHKLRIVDALAGNGHVVAVTGDGVNDAPALKKADIGVAMGITGTEVAKESADIVLSDDNFATIVSAIEEGRGIYENIRKTLAFLISGNIAEVAIIFIAVVAGFPLPLVAIQILWINLVTDGLPAIALAMDPIDKGLMHRKPRAQGESVWKGMGLFLLEYPIIVTASCLGAFVYFVELGDLLLAQTMAFTMLMMFEKVEAFSCRSLERPVWRELLANKFLVGATLLTLILHFAILYIPFLAGLFYVKPLGLEHWAIILAASIACFAYMEIRKWMGMRKG